MAGSVTLFLVLTFAASWIIFSFVPPYGGLNPLFLLGVFAPSLTAIALTWRSSGTRGVQSLLLPITRWNVGVRWYVFAIAYITAIKLGAAVLTRASSGAWPAFGENLFLIPLAMLISAPVQAGEEIGWRGYALPRLAHRVGVRLASIILGIVWAFWHLPLFYVDGTGTTNQSFPVYLGQVTALSVAMTWLLAHTRFSLWIVMVMHSAINQVAGLIPAQAAPNAHPWTFTASPMSWWALVLLWVGASYFLARMPPLLDRSVTDAPPLAHGNRAQVRS